MSELIEFIADNKLRLDLALAQETGKSRSLIKAQVLASNVRVNGTVHIKPSYVLSPGDRVEAELDLNEPSSIVEPVQGNLSILFEDDSLIVLNKPQGLVVHPTPTFKGPTLVHYLLHHFGEIADSVETNSLRPGIVHRLDKGTSGVLIVAKNRSALENLSKQFKDRVVEKEYEAIVWGMPPINGTIQSSIGRDRTHRHKMSSRTTKGRESTTRFERTLNQPPLSVVTLYPLSGRTHQIRVHLSEKGFPIVGDSLYSGRGHRKMNHRMPEELQTMLEPLEHPCLHARRLSFNHPVTGERVMFEAERPAIFGEILNLLEKLPLGPS